MKNKQSLQIQSAESAFKIIGPILFSLLQIKFSDRYNALYGPVNFFERVFGMCRHTEYAETACSSDPDGGTGIPTGRWLLGRIRHIRYDHMLKRCQAVTDRTVRRMRRHGMFREPVDIAIDKHLVCRYDRFRRIVNTIKSKPKKGTYNFNCLATANCIVAGSRAFLAARLVRRGDVDVEVVSGLIADCRKRGIRIKSLKIDREFFSVDIMDMLEREGIQFMVPAIKTKGVKKAVEEFKDGRRKAASRHSIDSGRDAAEFTLIIQKRKNGHFTLATNATVPQVLGFESGGGGSLTGAHGFAEQYRLRWGVETAYSNYESLRPPHHEQERVGAHAAAAVLPDIHLQRLGAGPPSAPDLMPRHAHDAHKDAQAVSQVHERVGPGRIPHVNCIS